MITITGATGHTGSVIANLLLERGANVRVVGRSKKRLESFEKKGAEAVVGDISDEHFFKEMLIGSNALYLLIPTKFDSLDLRKFYNEIGDVAINAIKGSDVKKIVFLSSLGAEQNYGTGPVLGIHDVEKKLESLIGVDKVFLRAGYFMENILNNIQLIKTKGIIGDSIAENTQLLMVATKDIAYVASEYLFKQNFEGQSFVELFGDRITMKKITELIGEEIGVPDLPYIQFPDVDTEAALIGIGASQNVAKLLVELSNGINNDLLIPTINDNNHPTTSTTFKQFLKEVFKPAFSVVTEKSTA